MNTNTSEKFLATDADTLNFGAQLSLATPPGVVIFLYGSLGAGKTTLTRGFLRGLNYTDKVKSPTYTLIEPYELIDRKIYHCDFYRLKSAEELIAIGIEEYFAEDTICLIEWPEKGFPLLPAPDLSCTITFKDAGRTILLEAHSAQGKNILQRLALKS